MPKKKERTITARLTGKGVEPELLQMWKYIRKRLLDSPAIEDKSFVDDEFVIWAGIGALYRIERTAASDTSSKDGERGSLKIVPTSVYLDEMAGACVHAVTAFAETMRDRGVADITDIEKTDAGTIIRFLDSEGQSGVLVCGSAANPEEVDLLTREARTTGTVH